MRALRWIPLTVAMVLASAAASSAQADDPPPEEGQGSPLLQSSVEGGPVSPMGAFLRAVAIPGWGHASVGAHGRGGFYLTTQAVNVWMLVRTRTRRDDARSLRGLRGADIRAELAALGVTDETQIQTALEADDDWAGADRLVGARQQQFEDWLALGIFTVLLSGADALVSAHLQDFPQVAPVPVGDDGRMEVRVTVPVGGR